MPEQGRLTWTDARLDDLSRRVDQGFARIDADLRVLSERIDRQGTELNPRIDSLQRTMLRTTVAMMATMVAGFASILATQL
jgi:hypothetical protein